MKGNQIRSRVPVDEKSAVVVKDERVCLVGHSAGSRPRSLTLARSCSIKAEHLGALVLADDESRRRIHAIECMDQALN